MGENETRISDKIDEVTMFSTWFSSCLQDFLSTSSVDDDDDDDDEEEEEVEEEEEDSVQPLQGLSGPKWLLFTVFGGKWLLFTVFGGKWLLFTVFGGKWR